MLDRRPFMALCRWRGCRFLWSEIWDKSREWEELQVTGPACHGIQDHSVTALASVCSPPPMATEHLAMDPLPLLSPRSCSWFTGTKRVLFYFHRLVPLVLSLGAPQKAAQNFGDGQCDSPSPQISSAILISHGYFASWKSLGFWSQT